jgi:hypothetical protein
VAKIHHQPELLALSPVSAAEQVMTIQRLIRPVLPA